MDQIKIDSFLDFKYIANLTSNPSQTQMAFAVGKANLKKNEYNYDLFVSDGKRHTRVTSLKKGSNFIWENDQTLLFSLAKNKTEEKKVKEEKKTIVYRYYLIDRKLEKAFEFNFPATVEDVLDGNKLLLSASLTTEQHRLYQDNKSDRMKFLDEQKKSNLYEDINEIPFYFNGNGFTANVRKQLFIYDIESQVVAPILDPNFSFNSIKVSDDKKHVFFTGSMASPVKTLTSQAYVYHLDTKRIETLYGENDFSFRGLYLLKNKVIVAGSDMKDFGINQNSDFYILNNKKLELLNLYGGSIGNSLGADVRLGSNQNNQIYNDKLYFTSTVDDHIELNSIDLNGEIESEYPFNGSIDGLCILNNQIFVVGLYRQKLQEIYMIDTEQKKQEQRTRINQRALKNLYVAKPKPIYVKHPSHIVKGWVLYPKDYDPALKYPAILDIHGGPKTVYGQVYYHEMQFWANKGYFVFFANPRGSDGKGDVFADIRGKYGTIDYQDLMDFTDLVLKKTPAIDSEQVFLTGGSYGGFMTNWMVGHTHMFKAAATQRSIANWLSFHGTSDIGFYFSKDQTAGHPNLDTDLLWEQSPMKYAQNIQTPLLFIHSDKDYRCPIEQAMQLFTILKQRGLDTKFVWFKEETHELSRSGKPQARIKRLNEITDWFEKYRK
ncbi:MAG: S9 family peptidase [Tenericutes bacterium]|nr:S9 family peptidase [Mycoplasmatota bacterium]